MLALETKTIDFILDDYYFGVDFRFTDGSIVFKNEWKGNGGIQGEISARFDKQDLKTLGKFLIKCSEEYIDLDI